MELYLERVRDLLNPNMKKPLKVRSANHSSSFFDCKTFFHHSAFFRAWCTQPLGFLPLKTARLAEHRETHCSPCPIKVREHRITGPYVEDLSTHGVDCFDMIRTLMDEGDKV